MDAIAQNTTTTPPFTAGWRDGFVIQSENGDFQLQIGALLQTDGRFAIDNEAVIDTFAIRRFRPYLRGRLDRRFEFFLNPDFGNGQLTVQDSYLDTHFSPAVRLRIGKTKTPFGLERLQTAANLLLFERALPNQLVPNRDIGVQVLGDVAGGTFSYQAGVLNGVADGGSGNSDTNDPKDLAGRVVVRPLNGSAGPLKALGLAVAGTTGTEAGASELPVLKTTLLQQTFFSYSSAAVADGRRWRYSPQLFYYGKSFVGFAEYVRTRTAVANGDAQGDIDLDAWQLAGAFLFMGEMSSDGFVRPDANFDFGEGHIGALQVAGRYHALTVADDAFTLGFAAAGSSRKVQAWTIGLNWFWNPQVKYAFTFERTIFDDDAHGPRPAENALVFRSQIYF
jgi:phosphate-selective porin OprO/OprP